jgi:ABC-type transport system involved in Fe-S cluster assembly fused permease/ATPase subunit
MPHHTCATRWLRPWLQAHRSGSRRCIGAGQGESQDSKDVRKHNQQALRRVMAVVPQEPFLFTVSIHENIPYGHEGVTEATFSYVTSVTLF